MHTETHPLAQQTVKVQFKGGHPQIPTSGPPTFEQQDFTVENWWDHMTGGSWMFAQGNPACIVYAIRTALNDLPMDDDVVYGKINGLGHLVHISELVTDMPSTEPIKEAPEPGTLAYAQAMAEADGSLEEDEDGYDGVRF